MIFNPCSACEDGEHGDCKDGQVNDFLEPIECGCATAGHKEEH